MPYAILRMEKCKGGRIAAMNKHHERTKEQYKSNPDIQKEKSHLNYHLASPKGLYRSEINKRISAAKCKTRKDSVLMIDVLIAATPEFIGKLSNDEAREYFTRAFDFMKEEVGEANIFTAVVHMDEKTPHMHLCFTPITKDGRLSTRTIFGGRAGLSAWQDRFHAYMSERWPELERGRTAAVTKCEHLSVQLFKQATRIDRQVAEITELIGDVSVFNVKKKCDELAVCLGKLLPAADRFRQSLANIQHREKNLELENAMLGNELHDAQEQNTEMFFSLHELEQRYDKVEKLLSHIPEDILKEAAARKPKERAR